MNETPSLDTRPTHPSAVQAVHLLNRSHRPPWLLHSPCEGRRRNEGLSYAQVKRLS